MKLLLTPVALSLTLALTACGKKEHAPQGEVAVRAAPAAPVVASPPAAPPPAAPPPAAASASPKSVAAETPVPAGSSPSASGVEVRRLVLATRVTEREPELALAPRVNEPLVAFLEAKNGASVEERVIVTFEHESGAKVGFVELSVPGGAKRWRTWARTHNLKEPGNWVAVVRSEEGQELGRTSFTVSAS